MPPDQNKLSVHAVIFDMDGTLIDSIDIYFKIVEIALERLKLPQVSRNQILDAAEEGDFNWEVVLPDEVHHKKDEIIGRASEIINEIAPQIFQDGLELIQGADNILQSIASGSSKIGMVTSTQRKYLKTKMPDPEPLIECARRLDVNPNKCVYVGDTRTDIKAGKAAGMKTVGVLTGFDDYDMLAKEGPDAIIDSIRNLLEVIEV